MEEQIKICSSCGEERHLNKFGLDKSKPDGHRGVCKECYNQKITSIVKKQI